MVSTSQAVWTSTCYGSLPERKIIRDIWHGVQSSDEHVLFERHLERSITQMTRKTDFKIESLDETASGLGVIAAEIMANRWTPRREQMTKSQQARKPPHSNTHITEPRRREEPLNEVTTKKVQWGSSALKEEKKKNGGKEDVQGGKNRTSLSTKEQIYSKFLVLYHC